MMRRWTMKKTKFLLVAMCLTSSMAIATYRFNAGEGSWSDAAMWDKGVPPLDTTEEIKITRANNICHVNSSIGVYTAAPQVSIANAESTPAKIIIEENGYLSVGIFRVGPGGTTGEGTTGIAEQTGGSLYVNDFYVSRFGGSIVPKGYYTISGGMLSMNANANGRIFVGTGTGGGYTEGTFTVVGSAAVIQMDTLYVGGEGTNYGKGTLEFQVGASGVSPIQVTDVISIDAMGEQSTSILIISTAETTLADEDIVLVTNSSSASVSGRFDSLNGGSAAEGTEIILADNIYTLTYHYAATEGTMNDIALVYVAGTNERPHFPNPADGSILASSPTTLSWTNPDPNDGVSNITCTVYLGTEPNVLSMDSFTLPPNTSIAPINATNFPTYGGQPLANGETYYWAVYVDDPSLGPVPIEGRVWSFMTDYNSAPEIDAGTDQVVWLGKSGIDGQETIFLDGTVKDDGRPSSPGEYTVEWTQVSGTAVSISPDNVEDTSVTITQAGTYVFMLTADDGEKTASDTVTVIVGTTACDASHRSTGAAYAAGDVNKDCIVNLEDFALLISANWLVCTDTLTNCLN